MKARRESASFLKKRSKKLLLLGSVVETATGAIRKSFLVLFFKKERLPSFAYLRTQP
jgi:hypothetical protein